MREHGPDGTGGTENKHLMTDRGDSERERPTVSALKKTENKANPMTSETEWDSEFPQSQVQHNEILYNTVRFCLLRDVPFFMTTGNIILLSDLRKDFKQTRVYGTECMQFINECITYAVRVHLHVHVRVPLLVCVCVCVWFVCVL